jgi:hypothetical protein
MILRGGCHKTSILGEIILTSRNIGCPLLIAIYIGLPREKDRSAVSGKTFYSPFEKAHYSSEQCFPDF